MSAATKKWLGTGLGVILSGMAYQFRSVPLVPVLLPALTGVLFGWLHLPQPSDAPKP